MEKLLQVMKENAEYLSGYGASEGSVSECHRALLTAIIEEMKKANTKYHETNNVWNLQQVIRDLEHIRSELLQQQ